MHFSSVSFWYLPYFFSLQARWMPKLSPFGVEEGVEDLAYHLVEGDQTEQRDVSLVVYVTNRKDVLVVDMVLVSNSGRRRGEGRVGSFVSDTGCVAHMSGSFHPTFPTDRA